ncbi:MAG TPA: PAS domain-containing sensor histidine kinase [Acidimicrobiales bacterium]|nr:PAS domain-containing sensor histidine kinase [Acidimicrobiales bacterium]
MDRRTPDDARESITAPGERDDVPDGIDPRGVLEGLPMAVVIVDDGGRIVWSNTALSRLARLDTARANLTAALERGLAEAGAAGAGADALGMGSFVVAIPTDRGVVEREVWVARVGAHRVLVLHADADLRAGGLAGDELFARLEAMLEHTGDIITVLDRSGHIRFSNAAAGRLTGLSGGEVNGRFALDLIHPDDAQTVAQGFADVLEEPGAAVSADVRVLFADGEWHYVEAIAENLLHVPSVEGVVVTLHDVTDRVRVEEEAVEREARLRSLVENLTDVIVVLDERFDVTFVSPGIAKIIDAPADTNIGMSALNDIHPDDLASVMALLERVSAAPLGATERTEVRLEARPGAGLWRWLEATAVNRLDDPGVRGIVVTLHDVTERKAAERQLQEAFERERETAERLRELDQMKDDFLATVSHELRTPLAAILGFAELLRRTDLDDVVRDEVLARLSGSASSMRSMVDNVLDFSALEAGKVVLRSAPVDVAAAVDGAISSLGETVTRHVLSVQIAPGVAVQADADGVGHVLRNLVSNAAKYSPEGSTITVTASREDGGTAHGDGAVRIVVEDRGIGMSEEETSRVFERFYRGPGASFVGRGSGIGLSIVRRYIDLMGGSVVVSSERGAGSRFEVFLPVAGDGSAARV